MKNLFFLFLLLFTACEDGGKSGTLSFGTSGSSVSASAPSSSAYAYLEVFAAPMSGTTTGTYSRIAMCELPVGTPVLTEYDCPTVSYDEALLYNSKLKFKWGTNDADACPFIKFYPYYYRASNSGTFAPEWLSSGTVDCSDAEANDDANCYGGVAPYLSLISGDLNFPTVEFFFDSVTSSFSDFIEVKSSKIENRSSNRMVATPPTSYVNTHGIAYDDGVSTGPSRAMADGSDGIVDSFGVPYTGELVLLRPYKVVCEDAFADPVYTLNFYLSDYDISPSGNNANDTSFNDYGDWDSTNNLIDPF